MKLAFYKEVTPERAKITLFHNKPENLPEKRRKEGIEIEKMPPKDETKSDMRSLPYINPKTKEVWWEYEEKEEEERIKKLEKKIKALENKLK